MSLPRPHGLFPATVTPFAPDLSIDFDALRHHLGAVAAAPGVRGLTVNGHLGEILTLTRQERAQVVRAARPTLGPDQILISGVEGRTAAEAVLDGLAAREAGAQALLVLPPVDVRPFRRLAANPAVMTAYFETLAQEVGLPMIVFLYPERSGSAYSLAVLDALATIPQVVAIKAATADVTRYGEVWDQVHDRVAVLAASDCPPLLGMMGRGTDGALLGISVIAPDRWAALLDDVLDGRLDRAQATFRDFALPLMAGVFENQEPTGWASEAARTKEALVQLGSLPSARVRPPAVDVDEADRAVIRRCLVQARLLDG
ncbi:MAG: dihydrodipicolinate synthase family protein [Propionibacteriaceae bacterium]|jgi:4-hydroxy-tetrahydrodipicolinate synthase|nr:dihydrodipicolinate synthase family protein [Propionibacteriaceae bacterium]